MRISAGWTRRPAFTSSMRAACRTVERGIAAGAWAAVIWLKKIRQKRNETAVRFAMSPAMVSLRLGLLLQRETAENWRGTSYRGESNFPRSRTERGKGGHPEVTL